MSEINGILRVDKPEGPTSHDIVAIARRALRLRRIGHTGTLDPFASGLLLLCLGPATRLAEYLTALPKSYTAIMRLGETTDTDDATGEVISRSDAAGSVTRDALAEALLRQTGVIDQLPPSYSAKKVGGERMYAAARRGAPLERTPSRVTVHSIELLRFEPPVAEFSVDCSSGTYIRSIARDIGEDLGVGAHLTHLRRTRVGSHRVDSAIGVDELGDEAAFRRAFLSPAAAVSHLPTQVVTDGQMAPLRHGGAIDADQSLPEGRPVAMLAVTGELLAIGERTGSRLQPRKVLL